MPLSRIPYLFYWWLV